MHCSAQNALWEPGTVSHSRCNTKKHTNTRSPSWKLCSSLLYLCSLTFLSLKMFFSPSIQGPQAKACVAMKTNLQQTQKTEEKGDTATQTGTDKQSAASFSLFHQICFARFNGSCSACCRLEFVSTAGIFSRLHALCLKRILLILSTPFPVGCSFTFTSISVSMYHRGAVNNAPQG